MKVLVIGVGDVGCALAIAAAKAGMETAVLAKGATAKSIHEYGLKRTGIFGEIAINTASQRQPTPLLSSLPKDWRMYAA